MAKLQKIFYLLAEEVDYFVIMIYLSSISYIYMIIQNSQS